MELFRSFGAVVSLTREPGDGRTESVLLDQARRSSYERNPDRLVAREEWHLLS